MDDEPRLGRHGGPRRKGQRASSGSLIKHGAGRDYILARLRREGLTDLITAIEDKKVSAFAVGVELGWFSRPEIRGTGSQNQARSRAYALHRVFDDPPPRPDPKALIA
jgi:hypothetical protein